MSSQSFEPLVKTLDLNFQGIHNAIAAYLIPHSGGAVLIETGPGSTIPALQAGLHAHGFSVADVTDVLLTHIHLDHAGAAGWLARQGARIHVHEVGAPHLRNPEKLLASAARIYGDQMQALWGEFLPVPEERLLVLQDGAIIEINGLCFRAVDTPGHANHHMAYIFESTCFSGDIGAVRMPGARHLRLPTPPPELNLELWRESQKKLQAEFEKGAFSRIAPTHFGVFNDPAWHLTALKSALDEIEQWMECSMPSEPSLQELREQFKIWSHERSLSLGMDAKTLVAYEAANPSGMSADGIYRYWHKVRNPA
jgi:glyoxylase-like metal-dependent hydrolase (beta-lactamase superfamily II)